MGIHNRHGVWHYRFLLAGKRYTATTRLPAIESNRAAAEKIEREAKRSAIIAGNKGPIKKVRLNEAWRLFLMAYSGEVRPSSLARIGVSGNAMIQFLGADCIVGSITGGDIEDFKAYRRNVKQVREVTIRHDLHAMAPFFSYCRKKRWIDGDPLKDVKVPSDKDAVRSNILTPAMEKRYFDAAMQFPLLYDFGRVLINQGMRPEEARMLRKADIDLERGTMRIMASKTPAGRRTLVMTLETRGIVMRRMEGDSQWIFPSPRGKGKDVPIGRLNNSHERACIASGVAVTLYDFRHTFATRLAETADIPTVCAILGHSNTRMVMRYVHPTAEHQRESMLVHETREQGKKGKEVRH